MLTKKEFDEIELLLETEKLMFRASDGVEPCEDVIFVSAVLKILSRYVEPGSDQKVMSEV